MTIPTGYVGNHADEVFRVGEEVFLENWLGGTYTKVRIVEIQDHNQAEVVLVSPGLVDEDPALVPGEALAVNPDPQLTYLDADYGAA